MFKNTITSSSYSFPTNHIFHHLIIYIYIYFSYQLITIFSYLILWTLLVPIFNLNFCIFWDGGISSDTRWLRCEIKTLFLLIYWRIILLQLYWRVILLRVCKSTDTRHACCAKLHVKGECVYVPDQTICNSTTDYYINEPATALIWPTCIRPAMPIDFLLDFLSQISRAFYCTRWI